MPALLLLLLWCAQALAPNKAPLKTNVAGKYFVDATCIDCDTCRWMAPEIFGRAEGKSCVVKQPASPEQEELATRAAVACPTGSIRARGNPPKVEFPELVDERFPNVYHCGFHSPKSFGATPYLVSRGGRVIMIDSPRFNSKFANRIEREFGAPEFLLLTHIDDVADHAKWKERFPEMKRVIHEAEVRGPDKWPYIETRDVEIQLSDEDSDIAPGVSAIHVPGHSRGHLAFLVETDGDNVLFTGDHLALSARLGRLDGFARYGWDVGKQADSIAKLKDLDFLHILPGHGRRISFSSADKRRAAVEEAARLFREDPYGRKSVATPLWKTPDLVAET
ncbi:hypothetical protein CTAYLR_001921 [Chrysophaeum taylorii]|uniref:Metallo-beta-lactamase domain-containing protein n=1 Tax=Chrysophaeum taylorii TaxID=2483200 RepID=A0AAD7U8J3_9STRA|nr:hypothetical protein CTAYLR_001921 [Chrysophaeum taylorii]